MIGFWSLIRSPRILQIFPRQKEAKKQQALKLAEAKAAAEKAKKEAAEKARARPQRSGGKRLVVFDEWKMTGL